MSSNQIVIEFLGETKKLTASISTVNKSTSSLIKGVGVGLGVKAIDLATDAVTSFVDSLGDAGEAFREDQVSQSLLARSLKNNVKGWDGSTASVEKYASAQARLGFQDDDIRASIGALVGVTHDQAKALEATRVAQDLSRAKGLDLATATNYVSKALQGQGRSLKQLGIDVSGATTPMEFLDAIQRNVRGSAEAFADTSEGRLEAANVANAESWEKVGSVVDRIQQAVLPGVSAAFTAVTSAIDPVMAAIDSLMANSELMQPVLIGLTAVLGALGVVVAVSVVPPLIAAAAAGLAAAAPFIALGVVVAAMAYAFNHNFLGIKDIVTKVVNAVMPYVHQVADFLGKVLPPVIKTLGDIFRGVFDVIKNVVKIAIVAVVLAIKPVLPIIGGIGDAIRKVAGVVGTAINTIVNFFRGVGGRLAGPLKGLFDPLWQGFRAVLNTLIRAWNSLKFTVPSVDAGPLGHIGGFTVGTPNIPYFHTGGIVPGTPGSDVLAMLQAGERVIPRSGTGAGGVTIVIQGNVYGGPAGLDALSREIAARLRVAA